MMQAGMIDNAKDALVFAAPSTFRLDVSGPVYWVFTPARLADGKILMVNRGFVPERWQDAKTRPRGQITGPIDLWFSADPQTIAAAKEIGAVAPFYVVSRAGKPGTAGRCDNRSVGGDQGIGVRSAQASAGRCGPWAPAANGPVRGRIGLGSSWRNAPCALWLSLPRLSFVQKDHGNGCLRGVG